MNGTRIERAPRFLMFGFRRGGSSIAFSIIERLFTESGLRAIDLVAEFHRNGVEIQDIPAGEIAGAISAHDLVGCFRAMPDLSEVDWDQARPILIIRDPRDCQLSWFHARYLHAKDVKPAHLLDDALPHEILCEGEDPDGDMRAMFRLVREKGGLVLRYEDLVADPVGFLDRLVAFTKLAFERSAYDTAIINAQFLQSIADTGNHNRLGQPYEALNTLDDIARKTFNGRFGPLVEELGYPLDPTDLVRNADVNRLKERDAIKRYMLLLATENAMRMRDVDRLDGELRTITAKVFGLDTRVEDARPGFDEAEADPAALDAQIGELQLMMKTFRRDMDRLQRQNDMIVTLCEQLAHSVTSFAGILGKL